MEHSKPIPVVIKQWDNMVFAVFPCMPTKDERNYNVFTITRGKHEFPKYCLGMKASKPVEFAYRQQMLLFLYQSGFTNLRYYDKYRPWMVRDKRLAEQSMNDTRTNQSS